MKKYVLSLVLVLGLLTSGCFNSDTEKGLLQGKVLITPTSSVEQPGSDGTLICSFYDLRKILIYDESGDKLMYTVDIECNSDEQYARYRVELEPGVYMVDINHVGVDFSGNVPKTIEIIPGVTTRLDITIDTGIRWY